MNAVEFVRKFGWDVALRCLNDCASPQDRWFICDGILVSDNDFDDLKSLVESYELVNEFDDIEQAKAWIPAMDNDMPYNVKGSKRRFMRDELAQAIADVESVGGGV